MTDTSKNDSQPAETGQSGRYSFKSEGRREHMLRLHAAGIAFGPRPKHGIRALEDRLKRGLDPESPLAVLHAEQRAKYIADLGGEANLSNMEAGICDRLADLDLVRGLLTAQRQTGKRMTAVQLVNHVQAVTRHVLAYVTAVKAVGPGRRVKDTDREIIIRRYASEPSPQPEGEAQQKQKEHGG